MHQETIIYAWKEYQQNLLRYIQQRVPTDYAEDILSDVFEKLAKQLPKKQPENLPAWLYRVSQNCITDYYRKTKNTTLPSDIVSEEKIDDLQLLSQCIQPLVQLLPENYRKIIELSELEGLKHKQVAEQMNLSLSAVKSRILRGREKLRQSLLDCCVRYSEDKRQSIEFDPKDDCC